MVLLLIWDISKASKDWKQSSRNWKSEHPFDMLMKITDNPCAYSLDEDCSNTNNQVELDSFVIKKKLMDDDSVLPAAFSALPNWERKPQRTIPYYRSNQPLCSCGLKHWLWDLGLNYYPRHVPTATCQTEEFCMGGSFRCQRRTYKVKVLRKREIDDAIDQIDQIDVSPVPESLRENWVAVNVNVTVACECVP